ncbi:MAG: 1,4-alpha-glucan branching protein GlgB [Gemmatimonadota bacterium]|nr:1,4-alpha-glucan branching protein GlgB [Gemmatimonadota bacterium]
MTPGRGGGGGKKREPLSDRDPMPPLAPEDEPPRPHGDPLMAGSGERGAGSGTGGRRMFAAGRKSARNTPPEQPVVPVTEFVAGPTSGGAVAEPVQEAVVERALEAVEEYAGEGRGRREEGRGTAPPPPSPTAVPSLRAPHHLPLDPVERDRLLAGRTRDPHRVLGAHPTGADGVVIRARQPNAERAELVLPGQQPFPMEREAADLFSATVPGLSFPVRYRLRFHFADGNVWERDDPYRFPPTLGDVDLHLFNEGTHRRLWRKLGAHVRTIDGVSGVAFAVWAPNAQRVSVIGDFCAWDGRIYPMRAMGNSGVWEIFIPEIGPNTLYKYELVTREGMLRVKTDPFAFKMEQPPGNAAIVQAEDVYQWGDAAWMESRRQRDLPREPVLIYEVHLGSWARVPEDNNRPLTYREIAPRLTEHVKQLGFTHIELLPIMEHPFYGSWGYQVSGYYAPTSRYGTPDDFRFLVDTLHQAGIGVLLDWVPAHFPKDDYALRRFDGTALFEHEDPRLGEHPDWGTLIFNYGRNEVRNFLVANALYWLQEFHVDGLRVDAVASMLYLDYSREPGEWMRNKYGGRENLAAIDFFRQFNDTIHADAPGCVTVAEESTAWPGVTKPANEGGLGFTFKWNMGWMHDTLLYFEKEPVHRRFHQDLLTFSMVYEYTERFVMPLSHDEVVHLKKSLFDKMPGDQWQKLANLRLLLAYQYTRPGKALLFMGTELAVWSEWNHDQSLDWHLLHDPARGAFRRFVERLGAVYRASSPLWHNDYSWEGFSWIDIADRDNSTLSYVRWDGMEHVVVVFNLTPVPREQYRIGAPTPGTYVQLLSTDDMEWGGSGYGTPARVDTEPAPFHGYAQSMVLTLPPLGAVILARAEHAAAWGL